MNGFFGNVFDFNHDGTLTGMEQAADFALFMSLQDEEEKRKRKSLFRDRNFDDDDFDEDAYEDE